MSIKTGVPVIPVGVASRGWRAKSWDRMLLPCPLRRAVVRFGPAILPPADADADVRLALLPRIQAELERLTLLAEAELAGAAANATPAAQRRAA